MTETHAQQSDTILKLNADKEKALREKDVEKTEALKRMDKEKAEALRDKERLMDSKLETAAQMGLRQQEHYELEARTKERQHVDRTLLA